MPEQSIPVVNLEDFTSDDAPRREAFVAKLGGAIAELGFVAVEGHGIPDELFDNTYEDFRQFFVLSEGDKRAYEHPEMGRKRGYTSFGVEHAKDSSQPDLKEFFHIGRERSPEHPATQALAPNSWPKSPERLKGSSLALFGALDTCAENLLRAVALYLGLGERALSDMAHLGNTVLRVIHYPVCDGFSTPGAMRAAAHEDINLMTLLPPADESGLELLTLDGKWLAIEAVPGQIIVDTGDMMHLLTNGKLPATTHRVVNPKGEPKPRYSMPFFVHPHVHATLRVFEECIGPGESAKFEPIGSEEYLLQRLKENGVA